MLAERLTSQALAGPPLQAPEEVAERILAIQAQDPVGARLAVRSRTKGLSGSDVDRALNDRSLVISWLNRGTLHLVRSEDFGWLHSLTVPRLATANRTRLKQEGVSMKQAEKGSKLIIKALADGPLGRNEIREVLDGAGVPTANQALVHILLFTTIGGSILRGPVVEGDHKFVLVEDWLGPQEAVDQEVALAELARRYLAGHTAADEKDLAKWAGITLGQARKGIEGISGEIEENDGLLRLKKRRRTAKVPDVKLLGPFDPALHGWTAREFLLPEGVERSVVTINGIFKPTILIEGQVAGIWTRPAGKVTLDPFRDMTATEVTKVEKETAAVERFLGSGDA